MSLDVELIEQFRALHASTVYEANGKSGDLAPSIRPIGAACHIVGPAFTVKCWPGDLGAVRRAVDVAAPGDVLVIDSGCEERGTTWGGGATIVALRRGLAGMVTNGTTRDVQQIRDLGFPAFCAGAAVRGGTRNHPGWLETPIAVGGAVIHPGDLVVADLDGVVVVPGRDIEAVLARAQARSRDEAAREQRLREGEAYNI